MKLIHLTLGALALAWTPFANARLHIFACTYKMYDPKASFIRQEGPFTITIDTEEKTAEVRLDSGDYSFPAEEVNPSEYVWIQSGRGFEVSFLLNVATSGFGGYISRKKDGYKAATLVGNCLRAP